MHDIAYVSPAAYDVADDGLPHTHTHTHTHTGKAQFIFLPNDTSTKMFLIPDNTKTESKMFFRHISHK
jgi:hypothetical protein